MVWPMLRRPGAVVLVAATMVTGACTHEPEALPPVKVTVVHGSKHVSVPVTPGTTVGAVLHRVGIEPRGGQWRSAGTGRALGSNGNRPAIVVRGRPIQRSMTLRRPSTIGVEDGADTVEATEVVRRRVDPPGLPKAIQHVHAKGAAGLDEVTVGVRSHEEVARRAITEPVPFHRATGKVVSLTFDDGPSTTWTPQVLAILADRKVPATFCQVGEQVDAHPELTRQIVEQGHQLCNHTQHHAEGLEGLDRDTVVAEITGGRRSLTDAGEAPPYYRPPGGSLGPVIYEVAGEQDEHVLYWSVDPRDWKRPPADDIAKAVITNLGPGAVVLLHDGGGDRANTVAALPAIIDFARALGYTFTLPISGRPQVG